ncbi:MAG: type II toxin-antitoxin system RelE/ParE family toxin [Acidimicrobiales bacterium]|jgi:mRNA interferase RelE/StbE
MTEPAGPKAYVRLTDPAIDDLKRLMAADPQLVRPSLKKMILLERNPLAGKPLLGGLIGWRKLTVGNRAWRIVWRVTTDEAGSTVIDIAEIWAVGARADDEVYQEMQSRLDEAGPSAHTTALAEVISLLGRAAGTVSASTQPARVEPVPEWLARRLRTKLGMGEEEIAALTAEAAMERWETFLTGG